MGKFEKNTNTGPKFSDNNVEDRHLTFKLAKLAKGQISQMLPSERIKFLQSLAGQLQSQSLVDMGYGEVPKGFAKTQPLDYLMQRIGQFIQY